MGFKIVRVEDHSADVLRELESLKLKALADCGVKMTEFAQKLAPVDTGELQKSIWSTVEPDESAVYVGTNNEYAKYVELGTGKYAKEGGTTKERWVYFDEKDGKFHMAFPQKPKNFIRRAVANNVKTYKRIITRALRDKS